MAPEWCWRGGTAPEQMWLGAGGTTRRVLDSSSMLLSLQADPTNQL